MNKFKDMKFKGFKTSLLLGGVASLVFGGLLITTAVAGCSTNAKVKTPECKKYPAWDITPSKPIPPKPKPTPPKTVPIIDALAKLDFIHTKDNLEWVKGFYDHKIGDGFVKEYLIKRVAPKLKFDHSKLFITSQKLNHGKTFWNYVTKDQSTGLHARYAVSKTLNIGCDFWIWPGTWAK